jgi:hypothetical protein
MDPRSLFLPRLRFPFNCSVQVQCRTSLADDPRSLGNAHARGGGGLGTELEEWKKDEEEPAKSQMLLVPLLFCATIFGSTKAQTVSRYCGRFPGRSKMIRCALGFVGYL